MYNWTNVDWTKLDQEIALEVGCTRQAVCLRRINLEIPLAKGRQIPRARIKPSVLAEPIDYKIMAQAFRDAHRQWHTGFPDAEYLERIITEGKADVASRPGPRQCSNSGGINIEWLNGKVVVKLDAKVATHYLKMLNDQAHAPRT